MAGVQLTVNLHDDALRGALGALAHGLTDMTQFMDSVGRMLVSSGIERIARTNVGPDGTAWKPSHRVEQFGGKTLLLSGMLMRSLTSQAASDQVIVGSNTPYAGVMHEGAAQGSFGAAMGRTKPSAKRPKSQDYFTPLPWGDIPARPYLGVSADDETTIGDLAQVHFGGMLGAFQ